LLKEKIEDLRTFNVLNSKEIQLKTIRQIFK